WMFFFMLGLDLGGPFMLLVALLCGLLVPHFRALTFRRRWLLPAASAVAGVCFVAAGLARAGFDARHPKADRVFYFLDADAPRAARRCSSSTSSRGRTYAAPRSTASRSSASRRKRRATPAADCASPSPRLRPKGLSCS